METIFSKFCRFFFSIIILTESKTSPGTTWYQGSFYCSSHLSLAALINEVLDTLRVGNDLEGDIDGVLFTRLQIGQVTMIHSFLLTAGSADRGLQAQAVVTGTHHLPMHHEGTLFLIVMDGNCQTQGRIVDHAEACIIFSTGVQVALLISAVLRLFHNIPLVHYLHDDNMRFLDFVEKEQLAVLNTDGVQVGAAGYGFCDDLPELTPETMEKPAALKDCWGVAESQESTVFSPDTFAEWFLPPIAEFANRFGHTSYGCCEPIHDRFDKISAAIHNLRTVSVTAWCDQEKALELLQNNYVYQRKPNPAFLSGPNPNWEAARKDLEFTRDLTKDQCSTQYLIRDVYDTAGDMNRAADWTRMAKEVFGI